MICLPVTLSRSFDVLENRALGTRKKVQALLRAG